ncbi:AMP-binding protein [Halodesulfovibrio sp.]|uniref:AMP-binding enzyme n=1 Tax=Halodesulfovibrio sp. TaxID=1912772 RepID=UPI0025C0A287|nr:AMP-binding protein [Halodesulfovibrio sp.]
MSVFTSFDVELLLISMLRSRLLEKGGGLLQGDNVDFACSLEEAFPALTVDDKLDVYKHLCEMLGAVADDCSNVLSQSVRTVCSNAYAQWENGPAVLFFRTSGSTGVPVVCEQSLELLEQEALFLATLVKDCSRVVCVVPQHHIYGFLFTVLLPTVLKADRLIVPPYPGQSFINLLQDRDVVIAFPMFWKGQSELQLECDKDVVGITSTGPCPAEVIQKLISKGFSTILEVYGSSETGGVGYRRAPDTPYELFPYWEMENDLLQRTGGAGNIICALSFPDNVRWDSPRLFMPLRRKDNAVQVAGRNVYPDRVKQEILSHPDVVECAVRLMRPEEGSRLKAFIVPSEKCEDWNLFKKELQAWCRTRCSVAELPKKITIGSDLPRNSIGKLADW